MKKKLSSLSAMVLTVAIILGFSLQAGYVYMPRRTSYGAQWNMFLCEDRNSIDTLFLGSSVAYCDIIPEEVDAETETRSYVLAVPEMTPSIAYYYLKEALKTQSPKLVAMEISCVFGLKYESNTKVNIGYMPYSVNRLAATFKAAEKEERLGLLFPLYNYHDRWKEVSPLMFFKKRSDSCKDPLRGYTLLEAAVPQENIGPREQRYTEEDLKFNAQYLKKILELCESKDIDIYLFVAPEALYVNPSDLERLNTDFGIEAEITDYNRSYAAVAIDPNTDYYDFLHLNNTGAKKFSLQLGKDIKNTLSAFR